MDFFKRHLNWTMGLSWVVCWLVPFVAMNFLASENLVYIFFYSFGFILLIFSTWYLRQKNRSEWWTLFWFPWFVTSVLALEKMTSPTLAVVLQVAPFFLILLKDRTWRPITE